MGMECDVGETPIIMELHNYELWNSINESDLWSCMDELCSFINEIIMEFCPFGTPYMVIDLFDIDIYVHDICQGYYAKDKSSDNYHNVKVQIRALVLLQVRLQKEI